MFFLGVVSLVRVMDGEIKPKDKIKIFSNGHEHLVDEVGVFTPKRVKTTSLKAGEVGYQSLGHQNFQARIVMLHH
jgi:GTP-binding protein LepA